MASVLCPPIDRNNICPSHALLYRSKQISELVWHNSTTGHGARPPLGLTFIPVQAITHLPLAILAAWLLWPTFIGSRPNYQAHSNNFPTSQARLRSPRQLKPLKSSLTGNSPLA
ncbi:hypothetical protein PTTG_03248 [Puccinia triticina 1-1 BBBD Race 1]|uniref:Uncharacterized protein n=1 Tax=Puccinia triticina (isolate 1-1 / race 1 (BBBD)) TaxID=630390 RepID=A0A0C4ER37_PUCT1|nr:hypothetical protein PTTG_03248 [Puccinia triticina 1-1 BBBD Race 1]